MPVAVILRRPEVSRRTGLCRSALYAAIQAGTFPQSCKLGPRAVGWIEAEVAEWIAALVEARDHEEPGVTPSKS
jgi:prophage regulatory protein